MSDHALADKRGLTQKSGLIVSVVAAAGLSLTLLFNTVPALAPAYQNRALHVAKETAAALVLLLLAALLYGRFRRSGSLVDLLAMAAAFVLAGKNLVFSVLSAILTETSGAATTWRTTGTGMVAAALLAAAVLLPQRTIDDRRKALWITAVGCLSILAALTAISGIFDFPGAFTDEPESAADIRLLSQSAFLLGADIGAFILFMVAGVAFARRATVDRDELKLWLAVGAIIASIGYLNYALFPSSYTDFVYAGDLFRVAAVVAWAIGLVRATSSYQSAYAETAVLEERRRVARDLHDGVAQELSFISSQMHWLRREPDDHEASSQIMESVERALDESRGAISALSRPLNEPLHTTLEHSAKEIATRFGARLELDLDRRVIVPPAWEGALPRILREAVANAVRHGRARNVAVHLRNGDRNSLTIDDNGEGFDPSKPQSANSYGLISMRERTEALGGEFTISSQPGRGTTVEIVLP